MVEMLQFSAWISYSEIFDSNWPNSRKSIHFFPDSSEDINTPPPGWGLTHLFKLN